MRLIFFGDLAQTGFGTVTLDLGPRLIAQGHDVRFVSQNAIGGTPPLSDIEKLAVEVEGHGGVASYERVEYRDIARQFSEAETTFEAALRSAKNTTEEHRYDALPDAFRDRVFMVDSPMAWNGWRPGDSEIGATSGLFDGSAWADGWTPEAGIVLGDVVAARATIMIDKDTSDAFASIPMFHYVPIEGVGLPPRWNELWKIVTPVAMSEFGADEIEKVTGARPPVIYHGIDTDVFHPVTSAKPLRLDDGNVLRSRDECREWLQVPDEAQVLFRADANMPRKRYPSLLRALAPVLATHPTAIFEYHTRTFGQGGHLADEISKYHPSIGGRMVTRGIRDRYRDVPRFMLTMLYNAADIYVSVSAEGFGLTIAEALACGTPAVVLDYSSCSELIGLAPRKNSEREVIREGSCGLAVRPVGLIDNEYDHFWAGVDEQAYPMAVARLLDDTAKRKVLGANGPRHVRETFSWDRAAEQFGALIEGKQDNVRELVAV